MVESHLADHNEDYSVLMAGARSESLLPLWAHAPCHFYQWLEPKSQASANSDNWLISMTGVGDGGAQCSGDMAALGLADSKSAQTAAATMIKRPAESHVKRGYPQSSADHFASPPSAISGKRNEMALSKVWWVQP